MLNNYFPFFAGQREKSIEGFLSIPYVIDLFSALLWIYNILCIFRAKHHYSYYNKLSRMSRSNYIYLFVPLLCMKDVKYCTN